MIAEESLVGQDEVLQILKALGDHATVPQMREYAKEHYPNSSMVTERTHFYNKLTALRKKWGLVAAVFDRTLGVRGLLVYYLVKGSWTPPKSLNYIPYPYSIQAQDTTPKTCSSVTSVINEEVSTSAGSEGSM